MTLTGFVPWWGPSAGSQYGPYLWFLVSVHKLQRATNYPEAKHFDAAGRVFKYIWRDLVTSPSNLVGEQFFVPTAMQISARIALMGNQLLATSSSWGTHQWFGPLGCKSLSLHALLKQSTFLENVLKTWCGYVICWQSWVSNKSSLHQWTKTVQLAFHGLLKSLQPERIAIL